MLNTAKIWIGYWARAKGVHFEHVNSVADMTECRKWCPFMNGGAVADVTDEVMFEALQQVRAEVPAIFAMAA